MHSLNGSGSTLMMIILRYKKRGVQDGKETQLGNFLEVRLMH